LTNITDPTLPSYYRTVQQYNFTYAEDVHSFAADNRVDLKFSSGPINHKMIAGVDYRKVDNDAAFGLFLPTHRPFQSGGILPRPISPQVIPLPSATRL